MAIIKCPECGRDVSNKAEKCIHCGYPLHQAAAAPQNPGEADSKNRINLDDPGYNSSSPGQVVARNIWAKILSGVVVILVPVLIYSGIVSFSPSYYVAKLPDYSAASVKIDGYMHRSKSCCQKVADAFGAEVIRVKPNEKAGTNSYGQVVKYNDCFTYCPLCCD